MRHPETMLVLAGAAMLGVCLGTGAATPTAAQATPPGVVVIVEGLRSDGGFVVGGLYGAAATWLRADEAVEDCHAPIVGGRARCAFLRLAGPTFAFAAFHDEDGDGAFGRDIIGLPREGYMFSNDAREPFGPPSFGAASFSTVSSRPLVVHARYGI